MNDDNSSLQQPQGTENDDLPYKEETELMKTQRPASYREGIYPQLHTHNNNTTVVIREHL